MWKSKKLLEQEESEEWLSTSIKENIWKSEGANTWEWNEEICNNIKNHLISSSSEDWLSFIQDILKFANDLGEEVTLLGIYPNFKILQSNNDQIKIALID